MTIKEQCQQAAQFMQFHGKRGSPLDEDFAYWADSKDFGHRDRVAIYTIAWQLQLAHNRAVSTDPMDWYGVA